MQRLFCWVLTEAPDRKQVLDRREIQVGSANRRWEPGKGGPGRREENDIGKSVKKLGNDVVYVGYIYIYSEKSNSVVHARLFVCWAIRLKALMLVNGSRPCCILTRPLDTICC